MRDTKTSKPARRISARSIHRAVASSTAIETGQSVTRVEQKLREGSRSPVRLELANRKE